MSDFSSAVAPDTPVTIPVEGVRRRLTGASVLPTERTAAVMVFAALAFIAVIRKTFNGARGD